MTKEIFAETWSKEPPRPTEAVLNLLVQFAEMWDKDEKTFEAIKSVYIAVQFNSDAIRDLVNKTNEYCNMSAIKKGEQVFLVVLFAASESLNINLNELLFALTIGSCARIEIDAYLGDKALHPTIKKRLSEIWGKCIEAENKRA